MQTIVIENKIDAGTFVEATIHTPGKRPILAGFRLSRIGTVTIVELVPDSDGGAIRTYGPLLELAEQSGLLWPELAQRSTCINPFTLSGALLGHPKVPLETKYRVQKWLAEVVTDFGMDMAQVMGIEPAGARPNHELNSDRQSRDDTSVEG